MSGVSPRRELHEHALEFYRHLILKPEVDPENLPSLLFLVDPNGRGHVFDQGESLASDDAKEAFVAHMREGCATQGIQASVLVVDSWMSTVSEDEATEGRVRPRDDQGVSGVYRVDVEERRHGAVFIHLRRRDLSADDPTEDAIAHGSPPLPHGPRRKGNRSRHSRTRRAIRGHDPLSRMKPGSCPQNGGLGP